MTPLQTATARALVTVFEKGRILPPYGTVATLTGDKGYLTYGATDANLADGSLTQLIQAYIQKGDAAHAKAFQLFVNTLRDRNPALITDLLFHNLLRTAADDPVMRDLQDALHDRALWQPALAEAERRQITSPLGRALVYDAFVQGSWETIRRRTNKAYEPIDACGEPAWLAAYVATRLDWLSQNRKPALRASAFRMAAFSELVRLGNWDLRLPIVVRGQIITEETLGATPPGTYDGPVLRSRPLSISGHLMQGADVRQVQLALSGLTVGRHVSADGIFGPQTDDAVRGLQDMLSYPVTGVVDEIEFTSLKL